jgi:hypothetical protein
MSLIQKKLRVSLTTTLHLKTLKATSTESRQKNTTLENCYFNLNGVQHSPSLVFKTFSTKEIFTIIKSIKSKNSRGYDKISTKI